MSSLPVTDYTSETDSHVGKPVEEPSVHPQGPVKGRRKGKKKGKPRPPTLTNAIRVAIVESVRAGATVTTACVAAGAARSNYYQWKKMAELGRAPYVGFMREVEQARRLFETEHVKVVNNASFEGDWKAAAWLLERHPRTRRRYGASQRVEHTGKDGGPIEAQGIPLGEVMSPHIAAAQAAMTANTSASQAITPEQRVAELEAEVAGLRARLSSAAS